MISYKKIIFLKKLYTCGVLIRELYICHVLIKEANDKDIRNCITFSFQKLREVNLES